LKNWHVQQALVRSFKLADKFSPVKFPLPDNATFYGQLTGPKIIGDIDKRPPNTSQSAKKQELFSYLWRDESVKMILKALLFSSYLLNGAKQLC
jgi:hypothetical protein